MKIVLSESFKIVPTCGIGNPLKVASLVLKQLKRLVEAGLQ